MFFRSGIRSKIFLSFLLIVILVSAVFTISSYRRITAAMTGQVGHHGVDVADTFGQLAAPYIFEYDYVTIRDIADRLIRNSEIDLITIADVKGGVWLSTDPGTVTLALDDSFYQQLIVDGTTRWRFRNKNDRRVTEVVSPVTALGKVTYLVVMELSLKSIEQQSAQRIQEAALISVCMLILSILAASYLSRRLTDPISNLVLATEEIGRGNFSYRLDSSTADEIGALSKSFNRMSEQLAKESRLRERAEKKLLQHKDNLEMLVQERTGELEQANQNLSFEVEGHRKTSAALRKSEERYRRLSEVTLEGIVLHDGRKVLDCNSSFEKLFGYTLAELKGGGTGEGSVALDDLRSDDAGGITEGVFVESTGRRKDGTIFPVLVQSLQIENGDHELWVTSLLDISRQKKLEAEVHQAKRLESIGLMAGGVAHDLNNILSGISGYPELMLLKLPAKSNLRKPLEAIHEAGERASAVVADLLTVARGVANVREARDLHHLVEEYFQSPEFESFAALYPRLTIEKRLEAESSVIRCSAVHIKKCLMNLVNNAVEAMESGGTIHISSSTRIVDEEAAGRLLLKEGEYLVLGVRDTGPGISTTDIEHIFEPFYSKKIMGRSGTGLGLTVVWNTMQDHAGKIQVESDGKGTSFSLYFPVEKELQVTEQAGRGKPALSGNGEHVLVVDDEYQPRDIASQMLEYSGYRVDSVDSGEEAVAFVKQTPVDLLVLDMLMEPGMNGYETYREICRIRPQQKAIVVSGFSGSMEVEAALRLGAGGFVKKPYMMDKLITAVRKALSA